MTSQTDEVGQQRVGTQSSKVSAFRARRFADDAPGIQFYTGLENNEQFIGVLHTLGSAAHDLNYCHGVNPSLSIENQHKTNFEMSRMFETSEATITNIFVT